MCKLVLLSLLIIGMLPTFAQTSVGITGGYNLAYFRPKYSPPDATVNNSFREGWRAGLIADHRLWKTFYVQPQLILNTKGENFTYYYNNFGIVNSSESRLRLLYLELQANFVFKKQWGSGQFFAGAGPYLSRGINGRARLKGYIIGSGQRQEFDYDSPVKFRSKPKDGTGFVYQKPYDTGLNFQAGYELKNGVFFNVSYGLGLTNQYYSEQERKPKNACFGVSAGYFLKRFS